MFDLLKPILLLNVFIFSYSFSAHSIMSPFSHWYCVDIAKNIDVSKPYAFSIGDLPLVAWLNETQPITTLNICKHMETTLDKGKVTKDAFGSTMIYEDKLWWSYEPYSNVPPATPYYKNNGYSTIMFSMVVDANIQDCICNTLDMKHYANIYANLFGKNIPVMNYKFKKYDNNRLGIHYSAEFTCFQIFQAFQYPHTMTAILSLQKKERLIVNFNMLPLSPNKTRCIITMRHNFWKSFFAKVKMDLAMKFILQQDKEHMSKQASVMMLKKSMIYDRLFGNEEHFRELTKMFRNYEYPDMMSTMCLYNYHNRGR
jgi:hypothetical protein